MKFSGCSTARKAPSERVLNVQNTAMGILTYPRQYMKKG